MHFVNRGPEPEGLKKIRDGFTQRWINHYRHGNPRKPSDAKWRDYRDALSHAFTSICGYCEELCRGEVDHFRPKDKFPERVYKWTNWVFSCHDCNHKKSDNWPHYGYVHPCSTSRARRPENYFDFDLTSGEIVTRDDLTDWRYKKAITMIIDLGLNDYHHLKKRRQWIAIIVEICEALPKIPEEEAVELRELLSILISRNAELSSTNRAVVAKLMSDILS